MARITKYAVAGQKGGIGKTTTVVNLADAFRQNLKGDGVVLVVDMDPQGQVATFLGGSRQGGVYELLVEKEPVEEVAVELRPDLWVVPGDKSTAAAQHIAMQMQVAKSNTTPDILAKAISRLDMLGGKPVKYVIFDTAPSVGLFQEAAIYASDFLVIPCAVTTAAMEGISELIKTAQSLVDKGWGGKIGGVVPTFFSEVTKESQANLANIKNTFGDLCTDTIHKTVRLEECQSRGLSIFEYEPEGRAAKEYASLMWKLKGIR